MMDDKTVRHAWIAIHRWALSDAYPDWLDKLAGPPGSTLMEALVKHPTERSPSETAIAHLVEMAPGGAELEKGVIQLWERIKEIE